MRLCIVTHKVVKTDGQGRVNYEVVREALRHEADVIVLSTELDAGLKEAANLTWHEIATPSGLPAIIRYQFFAWKSYVILKKLKKEDQKLIVVVNGFITWAKSDINAVHFVHNSWLRSKVHSFHTSRGRKRWFALIYTLVNSLLEKVAFSRTDTLIAVSSNIENEIKQLGITAEKIVKINNGVDNSEFRPAATKVRMFEFAEPVLTGLFVGDIQSTRKNLDLVLDSMLHTNYNLVVVGGVGNSIYPDKVKEMKLEDRVIFAGYRTDVAEIMKSVDFFVFPSLYEPFGLVILEALSAGLPVITTRVSGASDILLNSVELRAGYVMDETDDLRGIVEAINELASKPDLRELMSKNARILAIENNWEKSASKYVALFKQFHAGILVRK